MQNLERTVYSRNRMVVPYLLAIMLVMFLASLSVGCSKKSNEKADKRQELVKGDQGANKDYGAAREEVMERYFPLEVGNTWTYTRTVNTKADIWLFLRHAIIVEDTATGPYGIINGRVADPMPDISEETYTVIGEDKGRFWKIKVEGKNPRDGRYREPYVNEDEDPNVRWGYVSGRVLEVLEKIDSSFDYGRTPDDIFSPETETEIRTTMTLLSLGKIMSRSSGGDSQAWSIGARLCEEKVNVPAGDFVGCLKNVVMVYGKNLEDVLFFKNAPAKYSRDGFGCFMVESFYAENVGLIKEVQYDAKGDITYKLELKSCKITQQEPGRVLSTSDIAGPNISALQALDYVTDNVDTMHNETLQNYDLVDVVGSYYTFLQEPDMVFHRFPEWLFTFREKNTRNLWIFKVSDSRIRRAPDLSDISSLVHPGWIVYYNVVKLGPNILFRVDTIDELGRVRGSSHGQGPEDLIDEATLGANTVVLARSQVINDAIEQTSESWKVEDPNSLREIRIRQAKEEQNEFYNMLMPIVGWRVDIQEAIQIAIAKGAKPSRVAGSNFPINPPRVVRLYIGKWKMDNGTDLIGAYWMLPYRIEGRRILISASDGQLYASARDKLIFGKF